MDHKAFKNQDILLKSRNYKEYKAMINERTDKELLGSILSEQGEEAGVDVSANMGSKLKIAAAANKLRGGDSGGGGALGGAITTGLAGASMGASISAMGLKAGAVAGPAGMLIGAGVGALVGGISGSLKAKAARKKRQQDANVKKFQAISQIEGEKADRINNALVSMQNSFSNTLLSNKELNL